MEEELYALVVKWFVGAVNHALEHKVGFFELVPEEEVVVRVFNTQSVVVTTSKVCAHHVETRVHPATTTRALVVDALFGCFNTEMCVADAHVAVVLGKVID